MKSGSGMSMKARYWGFIKDPLYGYIRITDFEKKLIDTWPLQRLRRIRQLSGAEYVYPAANHTRFEHSLGTMFLAKTLSESLPIEISLKEVEEVKIASLLHDVGHAPFSHLFEPILMKHLNKNHEDMTLWIVTKSELGDFLKKESFDPERIGKLAIGKLKDPSKKFLDQILRSSVDVDKMDFVSRDSYHTGAGYGQIDIFRIIYTMDVLNDNLAIDLTAIPTLETFLLARLESFRTIYFHRASRAVQIMLLKALEKAKDELGLTSFKTPEEYLSLNDYIVWSMLNECSDSKGIMKDIERRKLLKCAYEKTFFIKDEFISSILTNEGVRKSIEEEIASIARVSVDDVCIDTPSLPSVPYHHAIEVEPMEIPIFKKTKSGEKIPLRLTELSRIIDVMKVFMNIIRVYTKDEYREAVSKASEKILGKAPAVREVSY
ncbi:MAG: HD domain-containing protein [Candidatus Bathyarchaeia archaeon]